MPVAKKRPYFQKLREGRPRAGDAQGRECHWAERPSPGQRNPGLPGAAERGPKAEGSPWASLGPVELTLWGPGSAQEVLQAQPQREAVEDQRLRLPPPTAWTLPATPGSSVHWDRTSCRPGRKTVPVTGLGKSGNVI